MNDVTKVRIVYECSIIGIVLLTFLKGMFPYMGAWWRVALIASLVGLWFSLSYLKQHNYKCLLTCAAHSSDVVLTMVDGKILYENGEYKTLDREKVFYEARAAVKRLYA